MAKIIITISDIPADLIEALVRGAKAIDYPLDAEEPKVEIDFEEHNPHIQKVITSSLGVSSRQHAHKTGGIEKVKENMGKIRKYHGL